MKTKKYLGVIVILAMLLVLLPVASVGAAPAPKVDVCHIDKDSGTFILINISDNAFDSHVAHGDASPGDEVPGQPGMKFADDCSVVPVKELVTTLFINALTGQVSYSPVLISGQLYQLVASGTYLYNKNSTGWVADAKCSWRTAANSPTGIAGWVDGADLGGGDPDLAFGLQVSIFDGDLIKPLLPVGWVGECNNTGNVYTAPFIGEGEQLGLFIYDNNYGDNTTGPITVEIWQIN